MSTSPAKNPESIATIDAALAALVLPFAATDDIRYYLNGIYITPLQEGGALIAATDGHMLFCARDPNGKTARPIILPLQKREHGTALKRSTYIDVLADGSFRFLTEDKGLAWISPKKEIDGRFPDIFSLIGNLDDWKEGLVGSFNPEYINRVVQSAPRARYRAIRFFHRGKDPACSAALFTLSNPQAFGVVMPMKFGDEKNSLTRIIPSEFKAKVQAPAEAANADTHSAAA